MEDIPNSSIPYMLHFIDVVDINAFVYLYGNYVLFPEHFANRLKRLPSNPFNILVASRVSEAYTNTLEFMTFHLSLFQNIGVFVDSCTAIPILGKIYFFYIIIIIIIIII